MDRILTNGRKLLTSNNNKLLLSRERTTGQRSGLRLTGSVGNHVTIPSTSALNPTTAITVGGWVALRSTALGNGALISKWKTGAETDNSYALIFGHDIGNYTPSFSVFTTASNSVNATTPLAKGKWYHIVGTYDGFSLKIYINGILETEKSVTGAIKSTTRAITIGKLRQEDNLYWADCILSNAFVFDKALTQAEIKSYMHRYLPADTPNLIEQWKLNEGVGTTVYGTKGNNGTITGTATWTTPSLMNYVGKQLSLNGTSQYINTALSLSGSYTKECWINPSSITGTDNILSGGITGFQLVDGKLSGGHNGSYQQVSDTVTITGHTHVAITYNDTTKLLSLYKNGLLIATATSASYTSSVQQIGAFGAANLFHGKLDDVRVWNYARTQTQIQENMNRTLGREAGLVLSMGFESDYYDASGYGNHGTPVGSPALEVTDNDKLLLNAPIN
jgi:hypothetical protein